MATTLCFDFGNTRLKVAVFHGAELQTVVVLDNESIDAIQDLINQYQPQQSILSSVINHDTQIETILAQQTKFHKLNHTSKLPITTPVGKPETIGADRLALCAAAVHLYPNQHNLVIGLGTCITYNFVNNRGQFLGGSISPGMQMRFKSMNDLTALLPLIDPAPSFGLVGYDTKTNLLSGVVLGMSAEINGLIDAYEAKYSKFNALLTGGDLSYFVPHLKRRIFADPNLIYKGLYAISEKNT